jgi:hypothetical protein
MQAVTIANKAWPVRMRINKGMGGAVQSWMETILDDGVKGIGA